MFRVAAILVTVLCGLQPTAALTQVQWQVVVSDGLGDNDNGDAGAMSVFQQQLYIGTANFTDGAELWRSPDGTSWDQVNNDGFGDGGNHAVYAMAVFDGQLYAATYQGNIATGTGVEIWRAADGSSWEQSNSDGFGDSTNAGALAMAVFGGDLYVGTFKFSTGGCEMWRSDDGTNWTQVNSDGFGDLSNQGVFSMAVFDGQLYAGTYKDSGGGGEVWRPRTAPPGPRSTPTASEIPQTGASTPWRCLTVSCTQEPVSARSGGPTTAPIGSRSSATGSATTETGRWIPWLYTAGNF